MKHQIFNQIQKVRSAASKVQGAKALHLSEDYQGEKLFVLKHETKKLRQIISNAQCEHAGQFGYDFSTDIKAIDLMEMGY